MAPLDLDKYVEIARHCKYLPENDLKVRRWIHFLCSLSVQIGHVRLRFEATAITLATKFVELAWFLF